MPTPRVRLLAAARALPRPSLRRIALAAALAAAFVAPARSATAQLGHLPPARIHASAQTGDRVTNTGAYDLVDRLGYSGGVAVTDQWGSQAHGAVDTERFVVRARAFGSPTAVPWATGQAYFGTYLNFLNVKPGAKQPINAFFHGNLQRLTTRGGMASAEMWFRVRDGDGNLLVDKWERQSSSNSSSGLPPREVAQEIAGALTIPIGYTRFFVELGVRTDVMGPWEANFGSTVNFFLPTVDGVTWQGSGGSGSKQFVPTWASAGTPPTTTAPEPATLALVGGGILVLTAVRRRRSPQGG